MSIFKSLAVLTAFISASFVLADDGSTVINAAARFGKKEKSCTTVLEGAKLYTLTPKNGASLSRAVVPSTGLGAGDREAYLHSLSRFRTPLSGGRTIEIDVSDDTFPLDTLIDVLKNLPRQKDAAARAAIRIFAVHRFYERIKNLRYNQALFEIGEAEMYAEMLLFATQNIFANNPQPKEMLNDLSVHFYADDMKFPKEDRYLFLTAILAGINMNKAWAITNGTFMTMILAWHKLYTHPLSPRIETWRVEDLVIQKVDRLAAIHRELQEHLNDPPN